jgi:hypothetical protein
MLRTDHFRHLTGWGVVLDHRFVRDSILSRQVVGEAGEVVEELLMGRSHWIVPGGSFEESSGVKKKLDSLSFNIRLINYS